jgi:hypothetical protein
MFRGNIAIHHRHPAVHQHDVETIAADGIERIPAVFYFVNAEPGAFQGHARHNAVGRIVFGKQDVQIGRHNRGAILMSGGGPALILRDREADGEMKLAAVVDLAARPDLAAHQMDQPMTDSQA